MTEEHKESKYIYKESKYIHKESKDVHKESKDVHKESKDTHKESKDTHKESKDYEKECILQKHDNVHKTYIGIFVSLLLGLTAIFFQIPFKEQTSRALAWLIAAENFKSGIFTVIVFTGLIAAIMAYLINKTAEYEIFLENKKEKLEEIEKEIDEK